MLGALKKVLGSAVVAASATVAVNVAEAADLPGTMVWSSYDLGSGGYTEASSIANAVQSKFDTTIRILPSGTSIGRLLPMRTGKAKFGFLANELFFAAEAIEDFAAPNWGPQDVRIILGRPAGVGIAAAGDLGAKTVADLKGRRIGYVRGNPSINIKTDAYLAFGGLTREDVKVTWFGSYGAMKTAIIANQLDAMGMVPTSSVAREVESSSRGIQWMNFPPEDKKGWKNATDVISFAEPVLVESGAGIKEGNPVWLLGYRYPMLATYAKTSEDEVYSLVKAIDESFDLFKNTNSSSKNWEVAKSIVPPADAPWHPGAIRYAKEKGVWTDEAQAWHESRLARSEKVKAEWSKAQDAFEKRDTTGEKLDPKEAWIQFWAEWRKTHLK